MKYVINLIVVFDQENRTLMINNEIQTAVELTKPATRVLNELIKNNGENLSRDVILKNAWEDFGYPASNPSLNNCISELRKSLEVLGLDKKIIVTIPRVGFKLEADIQPYQTIESDNNESVNLNTSLSNISATLNKNKHSSLTMMLTRQKNIIKKITIVHILLLLSILAIIYLLSTRWSTPLSKESSPQLIGIYKNCTIYTLHRMPPSLQLMEKATKMLNSENVDCEKGKQDIFYYEEKINKKPMKVTFFASCKKTESGNNKFCIKYKTIE